MTIKDKLRRWAPAVVAFLLVAGGTLAALPSKPGKVGATDLVPALFATSRMDAGTPSGEVRGNVEVRRIPADLRADGALSSESEIPAGVLAATHVAGQQLLRTSFAANRASAIGDGYAVVSVKLDAQRWLGPVKVTGKFVSVYSILEGHATLICSDAIVLDAPSTGDVKPTDNSVISLGVKREFLDQIVTAADEEHLWLTGK